MGAMGTALLFGILLNFVNPGFEFLLDPALSPLPTVHGVWAVLGNPAGLEANDLALLFTHERYPLEGSRSLAVGTWRRWGLALDYLNFGALEYQDETPNDAGGPTFVPFALQARLARSLQLDPEVVGGVALSYLYQRIYDRSYSWTYVSGGVQYQPVRWPWLRVGFAFDHLGPRVQLRPRLNMVPPLRVAAALQVQRGRWQEAVLVRYTSGYEAGGWTEVGGFVGWQFHPWVLLRLGYVYGNDLYPLRADLRIQRGRLVLRIGWLPASVNLGQTYRVALEIHPMVP